MTTGTARAVSRLLPDSAPQRILTAATLINNVGNGVYIAAGPLYFTRVVGLSPTQLGLGLTIAALLGLTGGIAVGHLADRLGGREVHAATMVCGAVAMAGFLFVGSFAQFIAVACLAALVAPAAQASRTPLIRAFGDAEPARFRAYIRSVTNLGMALGALIASAGIQADTRTGYLLLIAGNGVSYLIGALVLLRLPRVRPLGPPPRADRARSALRDRPFLTVAAVNGVVALHLAVPTFALPLWLSGSTHAPRWMISVLLLVNTVLVVAFQVRASRGVDTGIAAARRMRWAGLALLVGVVLIGMSSLLPGWAAVAVLLVAMVCYTFGEMWQAAAAFEFTFGLAPARAQGQYAGTFGLGQSIAQAVAPTLLGLLCIDWRWPGWSLLGVILLGAALLMTPVVNWALRHR